MKKYLMCLVLLFSIFLLTGCESGVSEEEVSDIFKTLTKQKLVDKSFEYVDKCSLTECAFWLDGCANKSVDYYVYKNSSNQYIAIHYGNTKRKSFLCVGDNNKHCFYRNNEYNVYIYDLNYVDSSIKNSYNNDKLLCGQYSKNINPKTELSGKLSNVMFFKSNNFKTGITRK